MSMRIVFGHPLAMTFIRNSKEGTDNTYATVKHRSLNC